MLLGRRGLDFHVCLQNPSRKASHDGMAAYEFMTLTCFIISHCSVKRGLGFSCITMLSFRVQEDFWDLAGLPLTSVCPSEQSSCHQVQPSVLTSKCWQLQNETTSHRTSQSQLNNLHLNIFVFLTLILVQGFALSEVTLALSQKPVGTQAQPSSSIY